MSRKDVSLAIVFIALFHPNIWAASHERLLYTFKPNSNGMQPYASLFADAVGNLYGTTYYGGAYNRGVVFQLSPLEGGGWREKVLHSFGNGTDGVYPQAAVIMDMAGNLYGTTFTGGDHSCGPPYGGCGTVFELTPRRDGGWTEKKLHNFAGGFDGAYPQASLVLDGSGNLYGTTTNGGSHGRGTVFELTPNVSGGWNEKKLHNFGGRDGSYPQAALIFGADGALYGTTSSGGSHNFGTAFQLSPNGIGGWNERVLHNFGSGTDGRMPMASLIWDAAGDLYGTTYLGGSHDWGTVFELSPDGDGGWTEKKLHNFGSGRDGTGSEGPLVFDTAGNLYGTTGGGGSHNYGAIFELTPNGGGTWTERILHNFNFNNSDGFLPVAGMIFVAGNLYGTTEYGGNAYEGTAFVLTPTEGGGWSESKLSNFGICTDGAVPQGELISDGAGNLYGTTNDGGTYSGGTVFELTPNGGGGWTEKVLYNLGRGADGADPQGGLIFDAAGNLYGTTFQGGIWESGTVFELMPDGHGGWREKVLYNFYGTTDGSEPRAGLILDHAGNLYGTASQDGADDDGVVFELVPGQGGTWTEKVLYTFVGSNGSLSVANLVFDAAGNLYGTTTGGGASNVGVVFELSPAQNGTWTEKVLHNFNTWDGAYPAAGLIFDLSGDLYGTTAGGGSSGNGLVFDLAPAGGGTWTENVLYSFDQGTYGASPSSKLIFDASGNLYGTANSGGTYGSGTVFKLTPNGSGGWTPSVLHNFSNNGTDGTDPDGGLILDLGGNLYGTTAGGGTYGAGTVYEITP